MSNPRRLNVYITGLGLISPAGRDIEENWISIKEGRNNFTPVGDTFAGKLSPEVNQMVEDLRKDKLLRLVDRTVLMSILASREATKKISPAILRDSMVIMGSGRGPTTAAEDNYKTFLETNTVEKFFGASAGHSSSTAAISRDIGSTNAGAFSVSATCASGTLAIGTGATFLQFGYGKSALVGGTESNVSPFQFESFRAMGIFSTEKVPYPSRPMDPTRTGSVFGEGASCIFLELDPSTKPLAVIKGFHCTVEKGLDPGLSEKAPSLQTAILMALEAAGLNLKDIDLIVGHGSSTKKGDSAELGCYETLFKNKIPPMVFHKWSLSHLVGASSAASVALACKHIETGLITKHPYMPESSPLAKEYRKEIKNVLVCSLGFSGMATALVISKP